MEGIKVQADHMIGIRYQLRDETGAVIDASQAETTLNYVHGHQQIFPLVEGALEGLAAGEVATVTLSPEQGFGDRDPDRIMKAPRSQFDFEVKVGSVVQAQLPDGRSHYLQVVGEDDDTMTLDGNHPLAGKAANFEVTVVSVRPASSDEMETVRQNRNKNVS